MKRAFVIHKDNPEKPAIVVCLTMWDVKRIFPRLLRPVFEDDDADGRSFGACVRALEYYGERSSVVVDRVPCFGGGAGRPR